VGRQRPAHDQRQCGAGASCRPAVSLGLSERACSHLKCARSSSARSAPTSTPSRRSSRTASGTRSSSSPHSPSTFILHLSCSPLSLHPYPHVVLRPCPPFGGMERRAMYRSAKGGAPPPSRVPMLAAPGDETDSRDRSLRVIRDLGRLAEVLTGRSASAQGKRETASPPSGVASSEAHAR
jgi:hypothetical protein